MLACYQSCKLPLPAAPLTILPLEAPCWPREAGQSGGKKQKQKQTQQQEQQQQQQKQRKKKRVVKTLDPSSSHTDAAQRPQQPQQLAAEPGSRDQVGGTAVVIAITRPGVKRKRASSTSASAGARTRLPGDL